MLNRLNSTKAPASSGKPITVLNDDGEHKAGKRTAEMISEYKALALSSYPYWFGIVGAVLLRIAVNWAFPHY